jgi:hypothetical protein
MRVVAVASAVMEPEEDEVGGSLARLEPPDLRTIGDDDGGSCQSTGPSFGDRTSGSMRSEKSFTPRSMSVSRLMCVRNRLALVANTNPDGVCSTQPATAAIDGSR